MGLEGEGYAIPMPSTNEVIIGKPTFTLYHPHKVDNSYRCDAVWLSNFDIQAKVQNFQKEADKDSDTEYSNIINEDFVNEMDSEELLYVLGIIRNVTIVQFAIVLMVLALLIWITYIIRLLSRCIDWKSILYID